MKSLIEKTVTEDSALQQQQPPSLLVSSKLGLEMKPHEPKKTGSNQGWKRREETKGDKK
jgi:hypothetical protein